MLISENSTNVRKVTLSVNKQSDLIIHNGRIDEHCNPGDVIGPIIRDFYVIKYCTFGCGNIILNDTTFPIRAGQCYVIMPGDMVIETPDKDNPWSHTYITLDGIKPSIYFNSMGISSKNPIFPWSSNDEFLSIMKKTITVCGDSKKAELRRIAYAYYIFDWLTSNYSNATATIVENYVIEAIYYMETNYSNKINVSEVSKHVGLNRSYFSKIFKEYTHYSPQEYLSRMRIGKACELFSFPNATVSSVANSINYEPSVFLKTFKRIVGVTPSEYQKKIPKQQKQSNI